MIVHKTIILGIIGACILIGIVSQAQLSQKNERTPLYEFRAAQEAEELGLAPAGSANSNLEFGSVAAAELTALTAQTQQPAGIVKQTGYEPCLPHQQHRTRGYCGNLPTGYGCSPSDPMETARCKGTRPMGPGFGGPAGRTPIPEGEQTDTQFGGCSRWPTSYCGRGSGESIDNGKGPRETTGEN